MLFKGMLASSCCVAALFALPAGADPAPAGTAQDTPVSIGDPVEAVVYRRTTRDEYRNELHAVLLALPDGRLLVSSSPSVKSP